MKKLITMLCMGLVLFSCSKDDSSSTPVPVVTEPLATAPVAKVENDASNTGVYKGVFVGSTGILTVYLKNGDNMVKAILKIDGKIFTFTASGDVVKGQIIEGLKFMCPEGHSFKLNVLADGSAYSVTEILVAGHPNATVDLIKEKSNALVRCYEGTYVGTTEPTNKGVFNMVISGGKIKGLARSNDSQDTHTTWLMGQATDKNVAGTTSDQSYYSGKIEGDVISGTWATSDQSEKGTFVGKRTL
jgi:hypothetical protein